MAFVDNFQDFIQFHANAAGMTREEYMAVLMSEAKKKPGPDTYHRGLDDDEVEDKEDQIKKQAKMDDDDPDAYEEMPGDKEAREKGEVKTSKATKAYNKLYKENKHVKSMNEMAMGYDGHTGLFYIKGVPFTEERLEQVLKHLRTKVKLGNLPNQFRYFPAIQVADEVGGEIVTITLDKAKEIEATLKRFKGKLAHDGDFNESVTEKREDAVNEKVSFAQMKKNSKTKEYKEVSNAIDGAEEVSDIWNMLDPEMFEFTEDEFEDIFHDWWNTQYYDSLRDFSRNGSFEDAHSLYLHLLPYLIESTVSEKREDVGKYNTVKKVIAKLGRRPSEQELATFITKNYYDVTEVERGEDDPAANDKIADLVAFYKFDIDDWSIAWVDAQNESLVNEADDKEQKSTDRSPLDDDAMETGLKKKAQDTGVPIGIIRAVMRRGLAAWKSGHRPGANQQQWGYARVNAFLTKGEGTWGNADKDLAKEVRDGGHDKKLKKA